MPLWPSGVSAPSVDIQGYVLVGSREFWSVLNGEARIQSETEVGHGRSLLLVGVGV